MKSCMQSELFDRAKQVYVYLHDRCNKEPEVWPYINRIATDLFLSRFTAKRVLTDIVAALITKRITLPRKRECDLKPILSALIC